jgi:hypothetical protein
MELLISHLDHYKKHEGTTPFVPQTYFIHFIMLLDIFIQDLLTKFKQCSEANKMAENILDTQLPYISHAHVLLQT